MARMNFIAGGYVGKLGATVGQRWKNVRVIRTWVKPHDPKTPAQLENRKNFSKAVPYAQMGMWFNKGAPCWDSDTKTEWSLRMKTAKLRIDNGVQDLLVTPIYPDGYTPAHTVVDLHATRIGASSYVFESTSLPNVGAERTVTMLFLAENTLTSEVEEILTTATTYADDTALMHCELPPNYQLLNDSLCLGASSDDRSFSNEMIYFAPQKLDLTDVKTITFAPTISRSADGKHIYLNWEADSERDLTWKVRFTATFYSALTHTTASHQQTVSVSAAAGQIELWKDYFPIFTTETQISATVTQGDTTTRILEVTPPTFKDTLPLNISPIPTAKDITYNSTYYELYVSWTWDYPVAGEDAALYVTVTYLNTNNETVQNDIYNELFESEIGSLEDYGYSDANPANNKAPLIPQSNVSVAFAKDNYIQSGYLNFNFDNLPTSTGVSIS